MEAMLYALATKFLDKTELRKVTEKINMALLGQLLMEDGIGKGEMTKLISLVMKKMKKRTFPGRDSRAAGKKPGLRQPDLCRSAGQSQTFYFAFYFTFYFISPSSQTVPGHPSHYTGTGPFPAGHTAPHST